MSCQENRDRIVLMIHGELEDAVLRDLEAHIGACADCARHLEEERLMTQLVASRPEDGPSPELLRRCRDDLHRSLASETQAERGAAARPRRSAWRLRWSPAWGIALVLAGFAAGRVFPGIGRGSLRDIPRTALETGGTISNVDFHETDPLSDKISLTYDTLRRTSLSGTAGDPDIRHVLLETLRASQNAGLRLEALDALRHHTDDRQVRQALLRAVREDDNAGARLKALEALREHASDDPDVRGAIMQALLKDTNPGVRVRAIDALKDVRGPETLAVMKRLADEDPSEYVRLRSAAMVGDMLPVGKVR